MPPSLLRKRIRFSHVTYTCVGIVAVAGILVCANVPLERTGSDRRRVSLR